MGNLMKIPVLRFPEFDGQWKTKKLSEVASIGRGKSKHRPRDATFLFGGKYPFIQTGDIRKSELYLSEYSQTYSEAGLKQSKLWDEDTLCITIAANIAETAILKIKACFPDSIIGLIPNENETTVLFVKSLFDKFKFEIQSLSQGVAQANLNQEKLSKIEFSFPSLPEQQKIVNFLTAVDEKLQALKKKENLFELYKKGVMQKLFSQEYHFTDEKGEAFPEWEMKTLGEMATITTGKLDANAMVNNGTYRFYTCAKDYYKIDNYAFDTEALLISGNGANVGYIHYYKGKFNAYQRTYVIDGFSENINYVQYFLNRYLHERINAEKKEGNTPYIIMSTLSEMKIMIPNKKEQTKIANFLSSIDEKISLTQIETNKMEAWKKGLLQKMFV